MILTCPQCATRYLTEGAQFAPPGRNVRCAKCGHVWFQVAPEPETELEPELPPPAAPESPPQHTAAPAPAAAAFADYGRLPDMARPAGRNWRPLLFGAAGWAALALIVLALCAGVVGYRHTIATLWPQSATLYAALGMPVNVRGIAFVGVQSSNEFEDGQPVLAITGRLVNISSRELPVPPIRVTLTDDDKRELYHWTFDAGVSTLAPGAKSDFITRLASPPGEARHVEIRFVKAGE